MPPRREPGGAAAAANPAAVMAARIARAERGKGRRLRDYAPGTRIVASDPMGPRVGLPREYTYVTEARPGRDFDPEFKPAYTPGEMLSLGVFSGKYLNDCVEEFPLEWFEAALARDKLRPGAPDPAVNLFGVRSRKPLGYWVEKGWIKITPEARDARGWFQWYCRYWLGRRQPAVDEVQIKRWKAFARHEGQIVASYAKLKPSEVPKTRAEKSKHRPRQRQALLQWARNPWR